MKTQMPSKSISTHTFIKIWIPILLGLLLISSRIPEHQQDIKPIAYFNFDEDVMDYVTHRYDAINHGASFVSGYKGGALKFDGIDDYVRIPLDINPSNMPEFTFSAWVKTQKMSGTIMSHDNGGFDRTLDIDYRGGDWGWSAFAGNGGVLGSHPVSVDQWTFVAVVYNQGRGTVSLFVDGKIYEKMGTLTEGLSYLCLGASPTFGSFFSGLIDEVYFYDRALTFKSLKQIFSGSQPKVMEMEPSIQKEENSLLAYYNFDEDVSDYSGNGHHAINMGATEIDGYKGRALYFDGKAYVRVPLNINPITLPKLTITAWVKSEKMNGTVVCHDNGGFDRSMHIDNRGGGWGWSAFAGNKGVLGFHPVRIGQWTFIAVVYDQPKNKISLFVDGQVYETIGTLGNGLSYLYIGANPTYGANFQGTIDEVRFYKDALSLKQLKNAYSGKASSEIGRTGPISCYFPFDGDVRDYGPDGYHGENWGAQFRTGVQGQAVYLDGIDDYIKIPVDINAEKMPTFSLTLWTKPFKEVGTLISQDNGGFDRTIDIDDRGGGKGWSAFTGSGGVLGYSQVELNEWTFIGVVYDQISEIVRLYVNDQKFEKKGRLGKGWEHLFVGSNPSFGNYFNGLVDELRLYNSVLTETEITNLRQKIPVTDEKPQPDKIIEKTIPADGESQDFPEESINPVNWVFSAPVRNDQGIGFEINRPGTPINGLKVYIPKESMGNQSEIDLKIGHSQPNSLTGIQKMSSANASLYLDISQYLKDKYAQLGVMDHSFWNKYALMRTDPIASTSVIDFAPRNIHFTQPIKLQIPASMFNRASLSEFENTFIGFLGSEDSNGNVTWELIQNLSLDASGKFVLADVHHFSKIIIHMIGFIPKLYATYKYDLVKATMKNLKPIEQVKKSFAKVIACSEYDPSFDKNKLYNLIDFLDFLGFYKGDCYTGKEHALADWVQKERMAARRNEPGARKMGSLTVEELFAKSYQIAKGDLFIALMTCHNMLRDFRGVSTIQSMLAPYRGDGVDESGARYHLFGMASYAYAQRYYAKKAEEAKKSQFMIGDQLFDPKVVATIEEGLVSGDIITDTREFCVDLHGIELGQYFYDELKNTSSASLREKLKIKIPDDCPNLEDRKVIDMSKITKIAISIKCDPTLKRHTGKTYTLPQPMNHTWIASGKFTGTVFNGRIDLGDDAIGSNQVNLSVSGGALEILTFKVNKHSKVGYTPYRANLTSLKKMKFTRSYDDGGTNLTNYIYTVKGNEVKQMVTFDYRINPGPEEIKLVDIGNAEWSSFSISLQAPLSNPTQ